MWEKKHPNLPRDPQQCSQKFKHGAVKYEIGFSVFSEKASNTKSSLEKSAMPTGDTSALQSNHRYVKMSSDSRVTQVF
jgi:hypothetical protein